MTEIRYYPLIDCNNEGTEKVAMFPSLDRDTIMAQSGMWLEEMLPGYFRLFVCSADSTNAVHIRCPRCGSHLRAISEPINATTQGLYICGSCTNQ